jgi:hypothetical protein
MGSANQSVTPGRTTLLEAVNVLLANVGEQPVNTLDDSLLVEAAVAERTLLELHKEGQTKGWSWNSEDAVKFQRNLDGEIVVPANITRFAPDPFEWNGRFILRGQRVFDRQEQTFAMPENVTQITAAIVALLPWDESPEVFNRWTTIRAARVFSNRVLSSDSINQYTAQDEMRALTELERNELEILQSNQLTGGRGVLPFHTFDPAGGLMGRAGRGRLG